MQRIPIEPRHDWREKVEADGLVYHTSQDANGRSVRYWHESAYYLFDSAEIEVLEHASDELHEMAVAAAHYIVAQDRFADLGIPRWATEAVSHSLSMQPPTIYGRFDLSFDGSSPPKLLEYNADTPTALIEAAITQWNWRTELYPESDQCNSLHERLVAAWRAEKPRLGPVLGFAYMPDELGEDATTAAYLSDTASEAGYRVYGLTMDQLGYHPKRKVFLAGDGKLELPAIFALYPWEWMLTEEFGPFALDSECRSTFIEPAWKLLLSNKAILAILWELYPGHPNLLPAYLDGPRDLKNFVRKPLLGREGASIEIVRENLPTIQQPGDYGTEGYVYQQYHPLPNFDGNHAVIGSWVVAGRAAGLGIRESDNLVTDEWARFCPHLISGIPPLAADRARWLAEERRPYGRHAASTSSESTAHAGFADFPSAASVR